MSTGVPKRQVRLLLNSLKIVDLVFEIVDARCPRSTRSPLVERLAAGKKQLLILNKADLADPAATEQWLLFFAREGKAALAVDSRKGWGFRELWLYLEEAALELNQKLQKKGRRPRELRTAALGIPNVGKSTFLNRLIGKHAVATGNRPGITRGPQWVHLRGAVSVLDTPGILPPQLKDEEAIFKLAVIGALDEKMYNIEDVARKLIEFLEVRCPESFSRISGISAGPLSLEGLAQEKKFLLADGLPDLHRAAGFLLSSFQSGKFGSLTLELPDHFSRP